MLDLTKENFQQTLENTSVPVMVDFYSPECGPCKMAMPVIEHLDNVADGEYVIAKVNVLEQPELAEQYGIMKIPTMVFFKNAEEKERMKSGDIRRRIMEEHLNNLK